MNKKQKRSARCLCIQLLYSLELSDNYSSQNIIDYFFKTKDDDVDKVVYSTNEINYAKQLLDYTKTHIKEKIHVFHQINQFGLGAKQFFFHCLYFCNNY